MKRLLALGLVLLLVNAAIADDEIEEHAEEQQETRAEEVAETAEETNEANTYICYPPCLTSGNTYQVLLRSADGSQMNLGYVAWYPTTGSGYIQITNPNYWIKSYRIYVSYNMLPSHNGVNYNLYGIQNSYGSGHQVTNVYFTTNYYCNNNRALWFSVQVILRGKYNSHQITTWGYLPGYSACNYALNGVAGGNQYNAKFCCSYTSYPPPQSSYPPPQSSYPPPQSSYPPPHPPPYPPPQSSYPPPQSSYPPPQSSYPPPQSSYPPPQSSYPPPQSSYPPPQSSYPPPHSNYPPPHSNYPPPHSNYPPPYP